MPMEPSITEFTVTVVDSNHFKTVYGKLRVGDVIELSSPGSSLVWKTKGATISGSGDVYTYTVSRANSDILGNIVIKAVSSSYSPTVFTVKTIKGGYVNGDVVTLETLESDRGFAGWILGDTNLNSTGYTVSEDDADDTHRNDSEKAGCRYGHNRFVLHDDYPPSHNQ